MPRVSQSTIITAPAQAVFDVISDPEKISSIFPGVVRIEGMQRPLQRGSSFRWEYLFLGMRFRGIWTIDELDAPSIYIGTTNGEVDCRVTYTLAVDNQRTRISIDIDYRTPNSVLKNFAISLIEPHLAGLIATFLETLKHYVERDRSRKT